ncbi:hypothetical protein MalM25_26020 [Planctomycetes bacterium MalM25]|nr:hypothetical protein MalM25_26020 [Planctomycetes bacterium MalM25]
MHHSSATLRLGAILVFASQALAEEPLVWKWAEGDTTRYLMTQSMEMAMNAGPAGQINTTSETATLMRWTVDSGPDESGACRLRQGVERVVMQSVAPMGQGFNYDSDDGDPPAGMAALVAPMFEAMIENDFLATMLPNGKITDVELSDELAQAFDRLPGGAMSSDMVKQMSQQGAMQFPNEPLVLNDHWTITNEVQAPQMGPMKVATTYTYKGPRRVDGRRLEVFAPSIEMESTGGEDQQFDVTIKTKSSDGEILFDAELGRLVSSKVSQEMDVIVKVGDREIVNQIVQNIELRSVAEDETPEMGIQASVEEGPAEEEPAAPASAGEVPADETLEPAAVE